MRICEELFLLVTSAQGDREVMFGDAAFGSAALADLEREGRIAVDGDAVTIRSAQPLGHGALDVMLGSLAEADAGAPRPVAEVVAASPELRTQIGDELVGQGVLRRVDGRFFGARFPESDPRPEESIRERLTTLLRLGVGASASDATLLGILQAGGAAPVRIAGKMRGAERAAVAKRLAEFAEASPWARGLTSVLREDDDEVLGLALISTVMFT